MSASEEATYRPGEAVPASGIYECDCERAHRVSTDVEGHPFPPLPEGCTGACWRLKTAAHPE